MALVPRSSYPIGLFKVPIERQWPSTALSHSLDATLDVIPSNNRDRLQPEQLLRVGGRSKLLRQTLSDDHGSKPPSLSKRRIKRRTSRSFPRREPLEPKAPPSRSKNCSDTNRTNTDNLSRPYLLLWWRHQHTPRRLRGGDSPLCSTSKGACTRATPPPSPQHFFSPANHGKPTLVFSHTLPLNDKRRHKAPIFYPLLTSKGGDPHHNQNNQATQCPFPRVLATQY